jgi:hypothetical protein
MVALNPNLPIVTTSSRSAFRRCPLPRRWYWQYVDGYKERSMADQLWFGIGIHDALAKWYLKGRRRGPHPADTFREWHGEETSEIRAAYADRDYQDMDEAKYEDSLVLGISMLEGYIEEYGKDTDWSIIAIERPFKIRVLKDGKAIAYFMSTWDGVYRDRRNDRIELVDHKTATAVQTAYLELDDQAGIYVAFAEPILRAEGVLKDGEHITGIMYNFLRKSVADERPRDNGGRYLNKDGSVSKKQPPDRYVRELVERSPRETKAQVDRLIDEITIMKMVMAGEIPITKSTQKDCPGCPFFRACIMHERGGSAYKEVLKADFDIVDPFDRYTKSAA